MTPLLSPSRPIAPTSLPLTADWWALLGGLQPPPLLVARISQEGILREVYTSGALPFDLHPHLGRVLLPALPPDLRLPLLRAARRAARDQKPVECHLSLPLAAAEHHYHVVVYARVSSLADFAIVAHDVTVSERARRTQAREVARLRYLNAGLRDVGALSVRPFANAAAAVHAHLALGRQLLGVRGAVFGYAENADFRTVALSIQPTAEAPNLAVLAALVQDIAPPSDVPVWENRSGTSGWTVRIGTRLPDGGVLCFFDTQLPPPDPAAGAPDFVPLLADSLAHRLAASPADSPGTRQIEFFSELSHELRTPLNTVIGMTRLLLQETPTATQTEYLEAIRFAADNALALVNDTLDFSKMEANRFTFEQKVFSLRELLLQMQRSARLRVRDKPVRIAVRTDVDVPEYLHGDELRLNQILTNLLSNAVKFTEQGEVSLSVATVTHSAEQICLSFRVSDTGIGIRPEQLSLIFERYEQGNTDIARRYGGTGLGLTITRRLVELQGGTIRVGSQVGQGSDFTVELTFGLVGRGSLPPRLVGSPISAPVPDAPNRLQGLRVLLAEDDNFNRLVAEKFLRQQGALVETASNGQIALDQLGKSPFDVLLLDLQMPGLNGYELARRLRQHPERRLRQLPIVALSAATASEVLPAIREAGMNDFIGKPFDPETLYTRLQVYVGAQADALAQALPSQVDFSYLELLANNEQDFLRQALETMLTQMQQFDGQMREIADQGDAAAYRFCTHKIKSTFNTLKVRQFQEIVGSAELLPEAADEMRQKIDRLLDLNAQVSAEVARRLSDLGQP